MSQTTAGAMRAAELLELVRSVDDPFPVTAIFPSEMAFFLSRCEEIGAASIVESGRHHAYSTAVLAVYGQRRGIPVASIDLENDAAIARAARTRLQRYPPVDLVAGDAVDVLARVLRGAPGPIALLVDGPKGHWAIQLSGAAAATAAVGLVALHDLLAGSNELAHFRARFHHADRLEDSALIRAPGFEAFREWERRFARGVVQRRVDESSLVLAALDPPGPHPTWLRGPAPVHTLGSIAACTYWACGARGAGRLYRGGRRTLTAVVRRVRRRAGPA